MIPHHILLLLFIPGSLGAPRNLLLDLEGDFTHFLDAANATACYPDVGCFSLLDGAMKHTHTLPTPPKDLDTTFEFYVTTDRTRGTSTPIRILRPGDRVSLVDLPGFDPRHKTAICVHGFLGSPHVAWFKTMREAFYKRADKIGDHFNLIFVDWSNGALVPSYYQAAANTELVGRQVGNLFAQLVQLTPREKIHLIGFSLGGHTVGFAGSWAQQKYGLKPKRITGLDPAGPQYSQPHLTPPSSRLDPTDAEFVDNIHTDAMPAPYGLGSAVPFGHVDFYPNGGGEVMPQPGCEGVFRGAILDYVDMVQEPFLVCSHLRAPYFFAETLYREDCEFRAFSCPREDMNYWNFMSAECFSCEESPNGCGVMGYNADKFPGRGKQYLATKGRRRVQEYGFCGFQVFVKVNRKPGTMDDLSISFQDSDRIYGPFMIKGDAQPHSNLSFTLTGSAGNPDTINNAVVTAAPPKKHHKHKMAELILFPASNVAPSLDRLKGMVASSGGRNAGWQSIDLMAQDGQKVRFCNNGPEPIDNRVRRGSPTRRLRRTKQRSIRVTRGNC